MSKKGMFVSFCFLSFPLLRSSSPSMIIYQNLHQRIISNARNHRRYIFTLEGKDTVVSASDPQPVRIPARARHTFKVDDTHEGPCTIEISTDVSPRSAGLEADARGASSKL
jgi:hypothetical protein